MSRLYFAYGSNMELARLEERTGTAIDHGIATLKDCRIAFNKQSVDGSGKTNIISTEKQDVFGVISELSDKQLKILDDNEKGYVRVPIAVDVGGKVTEVQTYVAVEERINNDLRPTAEYLGYLINGAREHGFSEEYQKLLKSFKVVNETVTERGVLCLVCSIHKNTR
jgi:hypothetical protein